MFEGKKEGHAEALAGISGRKGGKAALVLLYELPICRRRDEREAPSSTGMGGRESRAYPYFCTLPASKGESSWPVFYLSVPSTGKRRNP